MRHRFPDSLVGRINMVGHVARWVPSLFTRYIISELLMAFTLSSVAFVLLMVFVGVIGEALDNGVTIGIVVELLPFIIPKALMFALPATLLFSICSVYGRMASANEVTAIRAMGVSPMVMMAPAIALAFVVSLGTVWLNDVGFAWSYWGIEQTLINGAEELAYNALRTEGRLQTKAFVIDVTGVDGNLLLDPRIEVLGTEPVLLRAETGKLVWRPETKSIVLHLKDGMVTTSNATIRFPDEIKQEFPIVDPEAFAELQRNPAHLYLRDIPKAVVQNRAELIELQKICAIGVGMQLLGGDLIGSSASVWKEKTRRIATIQKRLLRLAVVPYRRWANGFSCMAFAIIGIPISLRIGSANSIATFGTCFLPILLFYYPIFIVGLDGAKSGALPPYAPWLGNGVCMLIGSLLLYKECCR